MSRVSLWSSLYQSFLNRLERASETRKLVSFELIFFGSRIGFAATIALALLLLERVLTVPRLFPFPLNLLGLVPIGTGVAIDLASISLFLKLGRGTPAPIKPPERLVVEGLYSHLRNPMYLGFFLTQLGFVALFDVLLLLPVAFAFLVALHFVVVLPEEARLEVRFGDEYREYRKRVPRWIPSFRNRARD